MLFTRQKSRVGENPESPARTQPGTNICEVHTPRRTVFTREQLYLLESDDEREDNYAAAKKFDISCVGGRSISSLSDTTVSV